MRITSFTTLLLYSFSTIVITTLALFFINLLIFHLKTRQNKLKQLPLPPGPVWWPLIGNVFELMKNKPTFRWLHLILKEKNSEIACVRFGRVHVIMASCPKIGLEFLKGQDAVFATRPLTMASKLLSRGYQTTVFLPFGDQWKKMRKILISEVISMVRLRWLHNKRMQEADNLVKYVYNQSISIGFVKIRTATRHYAGNITRKMLFNKRYFGEGMEDGGPGIEEEEHVEAIFMALRCVYNFCISDYFPFLIGLDLDGQEKDVKDAYMTINKYHDPIIDERIKIWRHHNNADQKKEPQDILDVLITLKDNNGKPLLSVKEIRAQTTEIMMAAIDNPSNAVEWAMAEMINQPELLQKAIEELDRVVGKERLVQESDIQHLNFVKACAKEAFRLHPVAPFNLPHVAMFDTAVAGYFIPKGSHVLLSRIGLGRNFKIWGEPLKFKPERHLTKECSEVVLNEPNLSLISFGTGRRGCIALNLGTTMTIMLLARLLQGFTWSLPHSVSSIDLSESVDDLFLAKPLAPQAKPRLPLHVYPTSNLDKV